MNLGIAVLFDDIVRKQRINMFWPHNNFAPPSEFMDILRLPVEVAWVWYVHTVGLRQHSPKLVPHDKRNVAATRLRKLIVAYVDIRTNEIKVFIDVHVRNPLGHTTRLVKAVTFHGTLRKELFFCLIFCQSKKAQW